MALFFVLGIVMLAAVALLALGWIAPLIVGLALRSRKTGHPRAWLIAAPRRSPARWSRPRSSSGSSPADVAAAMAALCAAPSAMRRA